jgi:hypothetical protein
MDNNASPDDQKASRLELQVYQVYNDTQHKLIGAEQSKDVFEVLIH